MQTFEGIASTIRYATALGEATLTVVGSSNYIDVTSDWRPLAIRRAAIFAVFAAGVLASVLIYSAYANRDLYYADYGHGFWVWLSALSLAVAVAWLSATLMLSSSARTGHTMGPLSACTILGGLTVAAFVLGRPTRADAMAALGRNDTQRAAVEGHALRALGLDEEGGRRVLDAVHLAEVRRTIGTKERAEVVRREWLNADVRHEAIALLTKDAVAEADAAWQAKDDARLDAIAKVLDGLDDQVAGTERARAGLIRVMRDVSQDTPEEGLREFTRIPSNTAPPDERATTKDALIASVGHVLQASVTQGTSHESGATRVVALERATALAKSFSELTGRVSSPTLDEIQVALAKARSDATAEAAQAAKEKALADAKQAREEARRKAQEAVEAAREQEANRSLLCCDGTESPSCLCHAASHQGCCSHHHGVCGCAQ